MADLFQIIPMPLAVALPVLLGYLLDRRLADPSAFHPIVGMGQLVAWGERHLNHGPDRKLKGALYNAGLILLVGLVSYLIPILFFTLCGTSAVYLVGYNPYLSAFLLFAMLVVTLIGYPSLVIFYMISGTTLVREVRMVFEAVDRDLEEGRRQVARIVGRDTASLSPQEIRLAALETLSENLSDGVVAPLFWWAVLGVPGIVMYKMINTQDSMVGYLNERYRLYGWFSARLDDVANFVPARLTAWLMLAVTDRLDLVSFVRHYGRCHLSPNSGYPEAALAGILGCRFGGAHDYFGVEVYKPYIGETDRPITTEDMHVAIQVNRRVEWSMLVVVVVLRLVLLALLTSLRWIFFLE